MNKREKADRLYMLFKKKFDEIKYCMNMGLTEPFGFKEKAEEYLNRLHIRVMPCHRLVSLINDGVVDSVAVRNPADHDTVIVMESGCADKILVLGLP